jgi:hypothetical protein
MEEFLLLLNRFPNGTSMIFSGVKNFTQLVLVGPGLPSLLAGTSGHGYQECAEVGLDPLFLLK